VHPAFLVGKGDAELVRIGLGERRDVARDLAAGAVGHRGRERLGQQ
jgi:hypothetical protein